MRRPVRRCALSSRQLRSRDLFAAAAGQPLEPLYSKSRPADKGAVIAREVKLSIGGSKHDPTDPRGRLLFNVLAMAAEFESDLIQLRTKEGMRVAKAKGQLRGRPPKLNPRQEAHLVMRAARASTAPPN